MEVCNTEHKVVTQTIHKKKKCNKAKWLSDEALQIEEKWKVNEKGKDIPIWLQSAKE